MAHLYLDESVEDAAAGDILTVTGAEARHAVTVARLAPGESILLGNGRGLVLDCSVRAASAGELSLEVVAARREERPTPSVVLVQALAKGDRDELAVQAATELGVEAVLPWQAQRSVSRWEGPKVRKGVERWQAIVREATKQSIRAWMPDVLEPATTKQVARLAQTARVLVLEPTASAALTGLDLVGSSSGATDADAAARDLVLVVGPEGGIAPAELDQLVEAGAQLVRLGSSVLRTSTAGPAALAVVNGILGRW